MNAHLKFMRLQFPLSCLGCQRGHILADGRQAFNVCIEDYGSDQTIGSAYCHTDIYNMVPEGHTNTQRLVRQCTMGLALCISLD